MARATSGEIACSDLGGSLLFLEKWKKCKFQPQKVSMNSSEKNETKATH